ncbi:MAG: hypothetical protein WC860_07040 [Candidatus Margulisiibacteriota bacterium]|jgi:hypothetical protein
MTLNTDKLSPIQREQLSKLILEFTADKDLIEAVKKIESSPMTTKNHYGRYMAILSPYSKDYVSLYVISEALKKIGANSQGMSDAIRIILG